MHTGNERPGKDDLEDARAFEGTPAQRPSGLVQNQLKDVGQPGVQHAASQAGLYQGDR